MSEAAKTVTFFLTAVMMCGLAITSYWLNQPTTGKDFESVGKPFFEDFISSEQAQSLEVSAVDEESLKLQRFSVENKDGLWRIPSHHNYPAEAAARLATTATSVMGIERESLAGRLPGEHAKLGVVDPLGEEVDDPEAVGKRITLKDGDGEVLVDFIIGNEAGEVTSAQGQDPFSDTRVPSKYYYVRRPDEQQTYKVKLDVDLSTRFSDWIDPDLLRLERSKLTRIFIDNYSLKEENVGPLGTSKSLFREQGDRLQLSRGSNTEPWKLAEMDDTKEELDDSLINDMVTTLDKLRIAGVRPKSKFKGHVLLTPDLELNRQKEFEEDPQGFRRAILQLQAELDEKGFNLAGTAEQMELVSQQGELQVGTDDGVLYTLQFGKEVEGEETAIEIGSPTTDSGQSAESSGDNGESSMVGENNISEEEPSEDDAKNRYLMIRVSFDESLLGDRPVKPVEPTKPTPPEGYVAPPDASETDDSNDEESEGRESTDDPAPQPTDEKERKPEFVKYDEELAAYEQAKIEYELAESRFKTETEQYESRIEEGKKLVDELNERFGDWYYVITADNLKSLQTVRADLVSEKEIPEDEKIPAKPDISFPPSELDSSKPSDSTSAEDDSANSGGTSAATDDEKSGDGENESDAKTDGDQSPQPPVSTDKEGSGVPGP